MANRQARSGLPLLSARKPTAPIRRLGADGGETTVAHQGAYLGIAT
jgi:hypothetical protein